MSHYSNKLYIYIRVWVKQHITLFFYLKDENLFIDEHDLSVTKKHNRVFHALKKKTLSSMN